MSRPIALAGFFLAAAIVAPVAEAADLGSPAGPVILTVRQDGGAPIELDRTMLEAVGWQTIRTATPFTEGKQEFSGVPLAALMAATEVSGSLIDAVAINDYRVEIPAEHAELHDVFLAVDQNGTPMRVRDRGPVWVIYPEKEDGRAASEFESFMVWQLAELNFR